MSYPAIFDLLHNDLDLFAPLAQSSAVICRLIEPARENGLDLYRCLIWLLHNAPGLSQTDEAWVKSFLPVKAPQECKIPNP